MKKTLLLISALALAFYSCNKDEDPEIIIRSGNMIVIEPFKSVKFNMLFQIFLFLVFVLRLYFCKYIRIWEEYEITISPQKRITTFAKCFLHKNKKGMTTIPFCLLFSAVIWSFAGNCHIVWVTFGVARTGDFYKFHVSQFRNGWRAAVAHT